MIIPEREKEVEKERGREREEGIKYINLSQRLREVLVLKPLTFLEHSRIPRFL